MRRLQPLFPCLFVLALACLLVAAEKGEKEAGFVPLFDGKTLAGWAPMNCPQETFFVKDGMLITTGVPTGLLRTSKMYENFVLELQWMHVKPRGNSGVFVWADGLPNVGSPFTRAIEVQVLDGTETKNYTSDGDLFSTSGAKFTPDRPHPAGWAHCLPSEKRSKPAGQWNHYRVECNNGAITLAVNGKVVSGGSKSTPRKGYICLEAEGSECRFRGLKIKELPSTNPSPEQTALSAKGHVPLFSGVDLRGWTGTVDAKKAWETLGGPNVLRQGGTPLDTITTTTEYGAFELICDAKIPARGRASLLPRGGDKNAIAFSTVGTGKWHRHLITLQGKRLGVSVDGKQLLEQSLDDTFPARGPLTLRATPGVEFANLLIRELK